MLIVLFVTVLNEGRSGGGGGLGGPLARFKHGKNSESLITDIKFHFRESRKKST